MALNSLASRRTTAVMQSNQTKISKNQNVSALKTQQNEMSLIFMFRYSAAISRNTGLIVTLQFMLKA